MKPFRFGIIGEYQSGKSLLINCLLRRSIATVGVGNSTTHTVVNYRYAEKEHVEYKTDKGQFKSISIERMHELDTKTEISVIDVYLTNEFLKSYILTDMPGFGANKKDNIIARKTLPHLDFALLIAWNEKALGPESDSYREIHALRTYNIPYYFILNCTKREKPRWRYDNNENIKIAKKDLTLLEFYEPKSYPLEEDSVNIVNFMWYWYSICDNDDELINREEYQQSFVDYGIKTNVKKEVGEESNFKLINKIFDMENRAVLELRRDFKYEIMKLREELCPIGSIQAFAFDRIPYGWLPCDGQPYQIIEYHELYNIIGTTFGGDGIENFKVPDLRGRFIRGYDNSGKVDKNRKFGTPQEDSFQNHTHEFDINQIKISKDGIHNHPLWCNEYNTVTSISGLASSDKNLRMCYPSREKDSDKTDLAPYSKAHTHNLTLLNSPISIPTKINNTLIKIEDETRPKNVALLYCIKCI